LNRDKPKLVLFDWDGTLVDTLPLIRAAHEAIWKLYRKGDFDNRQFEAILLMDPREVFAKLYADKADEARTMFYNFIELNHIRQLRALPHALDLIRELAKQGIFQGVVSKKTRKYLVAEIEHLGLTPFFKCIIATGDSPREKPHPDPILKALESFPRADKARTWYVGDAESDMAASEGAGTQSVLVLHGKDKTDLIFRYTPSRVFQNLSNILEFIKS